MERIFIVELDSDFDRAYNLLIPNVKKNTKIITPDNSGQSYMYHIAKTKMKTLVPNISRRANMAEDNTVARIHVCMDLQGCFMGYAAIKNDADSMPPISPSDKDEKNVWYGGYYLYTIPYEYALKPNRKLVPDADTTDECWLISYNEETRTYTPISVTKIIYTHMHSHAESRGAYISHIYYMVQVGEFGLHITKNRFLEKGYYRFRFTDEYALYPKPNLVNLIDEIEPISEGEFNNARRTHTTMLSRPNYVMTSHW